MLRFGTMLTSGNGDTIIAMPYGKWFPKFKRNLPNEMMDLQLTKVKKNRRRYGRRYLVYTCNTQVLATSFTFRVKVPFKKSLNKLFGSNGGDEPCCLQKGDNIDEALLVRAGE